MPGPAPVGRRRDLQTWGGCELPPGKLSSLRGQHGPKHMAMALASQPRPAEEEGRVGKVLPTPRRREPSVPSP